MIGNGYWSVGITLRWDGHSKWSVTLPYLDDGFCQDDSTEGELRVRYMVGDLDRAIDVLKADAEGLGIVMKDPTIYFEGDGEHASQKYPDRWREIANEQARRIGWRPGYTVNA